MTSIAIVGMGCRFGGAPDLPAYWELIVSGRDAFRPIPADRWDAAVFHDDDVLAIDKSVCPAGAFVEDIRTFPALALGIPPRRVEVMDPQHRLILETSLQAIEDSGRTAADLPHRTGVFVGTTAYEYHKLLATRVMAQLMACGALGEAPEDPDILARAVQNVVPSRAYSAPGGLGNMTAATVAQELDLHGPAYTVDSACASALVALDDAVTQLRARTIDAALAGGVYLNITPDHLIAFSRVMAISPSGRCLPFDARADGFVQGDGGGVVLLKRLDDALRDGDRVYAVVEGIATNSDGRGDGPMAPIQAGQTEAIRAAWADAGIAPATLGYLEAHGTGTHVGDATEFAGLLAAFDGTGVARVALGSSKANVGHTMSAAGIAGLIRAALAVHRGQVPPMANFQSPKEELGLDESPFRIPTGIEAWEGDRRMAGVSSFGFGGTNVHLVIGSASPKGAAGLALAPPAAAPDRAELLVMSAPDVDTLRSLADRTARAVADDPGSTVAGVARAWASRPRQPARLGVVAHNRDELVQQLRAVADGEVPRGASLGTAEGTPPKIAFLYPGQGSQRTGMLRDIRGRFEVVDGTLQEMEDALQGQLPVPLTHLLYPELRELSVSAERAEAELTDTAHCQPALVACAVALTRLLESVGVRPHVVTGHSLGENTAASVGGVMTAAEVAAFSARRGRAMADLPGDHGAMAAVMADLPTTESLLVDGALVANYNHPRQFVVSGTTSAIEQVLLRAREAGVSAKQLVVSHGFHSPVLEGLDVPELLQGIEFADPTVPVASGIIDHPYSDADEAREVFLRHSRSPVHFMRALDQCREAGADLYLQIGAGGPLAAFARGHLPRDHRGVLSLASTSDDDGGASLLATLARLWVAGVDLDVSAIVGEAPVATVPPTVYPRESYWAVGEDRRYRLKLKAAEARVEQETEAPAVAEAEKEAPDTASVEGQVLQVVSRVSAYPVESIRTSMNLVDDLGFDSLMVGDLAVRLAERFPGIGGIPQEMLIERPTVQDLVRFVESEQDRGENAVDDDAPLRSYWPVWCETAEPGVRPDRDVAGLRVLVTEDARGTARAVADAFVARGADVSVVPSTETAGLDAAGLLVHCADLVDPVEVGDVLAGTHPWPDLAGPFVELLRQQPGCDVIALRFNDDPWSAAVAGAVRCLAAEAPDITAKSVMITRDLTPEQVGEIVVAEWCSSDVSCDVRHDVDGRAAVGLVEVADDGDDLPVAGQTVLVTGGARGIGTLFAERMVDAGARVVLADLGEPSEEATDLLARGEGKVIHVRVDVTDRDGLATALAPHQPIALLAHFAGVLADGPLVEVEPDRGRICREVKALGWLNAIAVCGASLECAMGIGSWAGRFGNAHQVHYGAGNALLSRLAEEVVPGVRVVVGEFGPWTDSVMVRSIPQAAQASMRSQGVDFVGNTPGLDALVADLLHGSGPVVHGRDMPAITRKVRRDTTLTTDTHPFLLDHAIEGTPVVPMAWVTDAVAHAADLPTPFEVADLRLFRGITVSEPADLRVTVRGDRAEVRVGTALAYRARVRPVAVADLPDAPALREGGDEPSLPLREFYDDVTFHGPLLQSIAAIEAVGEGFVRGRIRTNRPADWAPGSDRDAWCIDPYAFDGAMQLCAYVAWTRLGRAGTPVGLGRFVQVRPFPGDEVQVEAVFEPLQPDTAGDRLEATLWFRDADGALLAVAEDVVAEMRQVEAAPAFEISPEWTDPSLWPEVKLLEDRFRMAQAMGIDDPYFKVQEGIAGDTTCIAGREMINYSSYNYVGLSGDPRVLAAVREAVELYGTSVSASRVASGERPYHQELERRLAACQGAEAALVFTAGHATNVTTIGHLFGPDDLVMHDELIHDSILQGIALSGASRRAFRHDDAQHLDEQLTELRRHHQKVLVAIEGVYSMDGDICDLPGFVAVKEKHGCMLLVDEAHSFGVVGETGQGVREHFDLDGARVDLWMGTLSKSLASCGGWIAGSETLVNYLRYTAPGFVYSAGLTAANGVAALTSLKLMLDEPWRPQKLQANAQVFHDLAVERGLDTGPAKGGSGVVPVITGNSLHALMLAQRLGDRGINVQPIIFPAVAEDAARLRFFISSLHSEDQLTRSADLIAEILTEVRAEF